MGRTEKPELKYDKTRIYDHNFCFARGMNRKLEFRIRIVHSIIYFKPSQK